MSAESGLVRHDREKLLNAIAYFAENTQDCRKTKLLKLLYYLDFEHYKAVGRNVTGLQYQAWDLGPVAKSLWQELKSPAPDMLEQLSFEYESVSFPDNPDAEMMTIRPLRPFDASHFSRRELEILERLAKRYRYHTAKQMKDETHREGGPWHQVYEIEGHRNGEIPYSYVLSGVEDREAIEEVARDHEAALEKYS